MNLVTCNTSWTQYNDTRSRCIETLSIKSPEDVLQSDFILSCEIPFSKIGINLYCPSSHLSQANIGNINDNLYFLDGSNSYIEIGFVRQASEPISQLGSFLQNIISNIVVDTGTGNTGQQFLTDLFTTFNEEHFNIILLASFTGVSIGYSFGLLLNVVRKGKNVL